MELYKTEHKKASSIIKSRKTLSIVNLLCFRLNSELSEKILVRIRINVIIRILWAILMFMKVMYNGTIENGSG